MPADCRSRRARPRSAELFSRRRGGGLGPYLAVYLLTLRQWNEAEIGMVMSIAGIVGIAAHVAAGALVDWLHAKRALIGGALLVTAGALSLSALPGFWSVAAVQAAIGACGAVFGPAISGVTIGIVGHRRFAARDGRNEAFNHAGNAVAAAVAGAAAYLWGPVAVFLLIALMGLASSASVAAIPARAIDHDQARGLGDGDRHHALPSRLFAVLGNPRLLVFGACVLLFHLANAAMLPLVGQKLALHDPSQGAVLMSACILGAQLVMVPVAMLAGRNAGRWGRKPLFLAGFLILALRGWLYTLSDDRSWLLAVQLLDGVGAGLFGVLCPLIVSDLTLGSGRFNVSQGTIAIGQDIGASLSTTVAGVIVVAVGYSAAFLTLAAIATAGLITLLVGIPETRDTGGAAPAALGAEARRAVPVLPSAGFE